jgi:hypothetical protein
LSAPLLNELYAERRPGCCVICDLPLPKRKAGRKPRSMHPGECTKTYLRLYAAAWRAIGGHIRKAGRAVASANQEISKL